MRVQLISQHFRARICTVLVADSARTNVKSVCDRYKSNWFNCTVQPSDHTWWFQQGLLHIPALLEIFERWAMPTKIIVHVHGAGTNQGRGLFCLEADNRCGKNSRKYSICVYSHYCKSNYMTVEWQRIQHLWMDSGSLCHEYCYC